MFTNNQSVFSIKNNTPLFGAGTIPSVFGSKDINSNNFWISNNSNSNGLFKTGFGFGLGNPVNNQTSSFGNSNLFAKQTKPAQIFGQKSSSNLIPKDSEISNNVKMNQSSQSYQSKNTRVKDYVRCITLNEQKNMFNLTKRQLMINYANTEQFQRIKKQATKNKSSSSSIPLFKFNVQKKSEKKSNFLQFPKNLFKKEQNFDDIQYRQLRKDPLFNKLLQTKLFKKLQQNNQIKQIKEALNQISPLIKQQIDSKIKQFNQKVIQNNYPMKLFTTTQKQKNIYQKQEKNIKKQHIGFLQELTPKKSNQKLVGNIFSCDEPSYFGKPVFGQINSWPTNLFKAFDQNKGFQFTTANQEISKQSNFDKEKIEKKDNQSSNLSINQSIEKQQPVQLTAQLTINSEEESQISHKRINKIKARKDIAKKKQQLSKKSEISNYGNSSQQNQITIVQQQNIILKNMQRQHSRIIHQNPKGRLAKKKQKKKCYDQQAAEEE